MCTRKLCGERVSASGNDESEFRIDDGTKAAAGEDFQLAGRMDIGFRLTRRGDMIEIDLGFLL